MVPDLTLEVIYLNQPTDFKMEFELCSSSNVRFLSLPVKSQGEFLTALSKSVVRSRAIITVGSFNPLDKLYIPKIIAKATGYELGAVENEKIVIAAEKSVFLPKTSLPLVDSNGNLGGCVLENNDQTIIMLTSDRELRHTIVSDLVCPYLKLFATKKGQTGNGAVPNKTDNAEPKQEENGNQHPPQEDVMPTIEELTNVFIPPAVQTQENDNSQEENITVAPVEQIPSQADSETDLQEPQINTNAESPEQNPPAHPGYTVLEQPNANGGAEFDLGGLLLDDEEDKESKPKKSRPVIKVIISIILVVAVILAAYFGYDRLYQPMQRNSVYEEIRSLYGQTWSELPEDMLYKFGKLYQTNSDIYGWLSIPDTNINLPVVSAAKKSAAYYRSHLFDGSVNRYGTPYTVNKPDTEYKRNFIIYGKNMGDGTMFSELETFLDVEKYKKVPTFSFDTLYFENKWKIFSVFKINPQRKNGLFKTDFFDDNAFSEYLTLMQELSVIETNIDVTCSDQIITLVSLGDDNDVVMVARMVRDNETPMVDVTGVTVNDTATDSSDIAVNAIPLEPIETSSEDSQTSEYIDQNMIDGASSRYEQQEPVASEIEITPTVPTITSVPDISSEKHSSSSVTTTSKAQISSNVSSSKPSTSTSSFVSSSSPQANKFPILTVTNTFNGKRVEGNALDIVAQNIEAEMGKSYEMEALKAQAVAAYSWLLNNGAANNKYPSLPLKTPSQKCIDAVNAVAGQVAVYNGKIATTYYYAISAGRSAYSQDIWSSAVPYLVSVDSSVDKNVNGYQTVRKYSSEKVAQIAKDTLGIDLSTITDKNKWFTCSYDVNGIYCTKIKIGNIEKKGTYMRDSFFTSSRVGSSNVLRSSAYTIKYDENEDNFIFTVKGYGHGVGMSQTGANQYAKKGWNYEEILKHYYTGITLGTYCAS